MSSFVRYVPIASFRVANFIEKASQLYEQKRSAVLAATALEMYVRRWVRWTTSGRVDLLNHRDVPSLGYAPRESAY
jgi:hypothetical protein